MTLLLLLALNMKVMMQIIAWLTKGIIHPISFLIIGNGKKNGLPKSWIFLLLNWINRQRVRCTAMDGGIFLLRSGNRLQDG